jgi:hypothetical protein
VKKSTFTRVEVRLSKEYADFLDEARRTAGSSRSHRLTTTIVANAALAKYLKDLPAKVAEEIVKLKVRRNE